MEMLTKEQALRLERDTPLLVAAQHATGRRQGERVEFLRCIGDMAVVRTQDHTLTAFHIGTLSLEPKRGPP